MKSKLLIAFVLFVFIGNSSHLPIHADNATINIAQLSIGINHGLVLTDENELFAFGNRINGNFGDDNQTNQLTNRLINISTMGDLATEDFTADPIKKIEANNTMSALLTTNGDLYLWGNNQTGSVGNGTTTNQYTPLNVNGFGDLASLSGGDYLIDVSLNANNGGNNNGVLALSQAGKLFYWGAVRLGMSGEGSTENLTLPKEITTAGELANLVAPDKLVSISAGNLTLGVVSESGRVFTWGFNSLGQAVGASAIGSAFTQNSPIEITTSGFLNDLSGLSDKVVSIKMNQFSGMVKTQAGRYIIWGLNTEGQAGQAIRGQYILPVEVTNQGAFAELDVANNETIEQIEVGGSSYIALTSLGNIYTWGWNNSGSLGTDSTLGYGLLSTTINTFGALATLNVDEKIVRVFKQSLTTIALTNQNRLIGWGPNASGLYFGSSIPSSNIPVDLTEALNNSLKEPFELVINLIDALPTLANIALEDEQQVEAARTAYDALTVEQQALVTNYQALLDAESRLALLNQQAIDQAAANEVIALIDAFPELNGLTLEDEDQVEAARTAYDSLTPDQQALVTNYQELIDAEAKIALLKQQVIDQAAADEVIALIDAFPELNALTLEDETQVEAARTAYDALTLDQKSLVTNYQALVDAEARLALLSQQVIDQAASQAVIALINALPEVEALTLEDEAQVVAARAAFDALTPSQQSLVTNLEVLVNAENTLAGLSENQGSPLMIVIIFATIISLLSMIYWFLIGKKKQAKPVSAPIVTNPITPTPIEPTIATIQLDDVKLSNFDTRPKFQPLSKVNPGFYLEITSEKESTNRVVEVQDLLPEGLDETNSFVSISKEEVKQVKLELTSTSQFVKKTPGSFVDPGYYVEVDLQDKIVDNYILAKKRLPPSSAKGHRWIRIEKRKITK
jgi:alpha-tubulin suppressor-like RCC1 family protein/predicted transcriptional regulator